MVAVAEMSGTSCSLTSCLPAPDTCQLSGQPGPINPLLGSLVLTSQLTCHFLQEAFPDYHNQ